MKTFDFLGSYVLDQLAKTYTVKELDLGGDAALSKKGMHFFTKCYDVEGLGHLCVMTMNAMLGMMKMETVVLSVTGKDAPLINLDMVQAMGKETFMAEFYDDQLSPLPQEQAAAYEALRQRDKDIPDYVSGPHWYDDIRYPFSYAKTGKGFTERFQAAGKAYFEEYLRQLALLPACDREEKGAKVSAFAQTLYSQGGPAVDQVKNLFGDEIAGRLVKTHMYGC